MSENTLAVVLSLKYRTCPKVARDSEIGCFCTLNTLRGRGYKNRDISLRFPLGISKQ